MFELDDGEVLRGKVRGGWDADGLRVEAAEFDLAKAYRQLASARSHACFSVISTWNSRAKRRELYRQPVLAFGAASSVQHFCWVARGLLWILIEVLGVVCTHYVDNFPILTYKAVSAEAADAVNSLFDVLGWTIKPPEPFSQSFASLGVVFTFGPPGTCVKIANKDERLADMRLAVTLLRRRARLSQAEARSLRGRIAYSRAHVFGRCGAPALYLLGQVADGADFSQDASDEAVRALGALVEMLAAAPARLLMALVPRPFVLFTDGACEPDERGELVATCGGVLFWPGGERCQYFGVTVEQPLLGDWLAEGSKQVVAQAELLPILIAKWTWRSALSGQPLLVFIDNDGVRHGLVSGASSNASSRLMLEASAYADCTLGVAQWVARVPSFSNPADGPSRLDFSGVEAFSTSSRASLLLPDGQPFSWSGAARAIKG